MHHDDFEKKMRALEYFHSVKLLPGAWAVVRVDGHSFSRYTNNRFEKPFDERFHNLMVQTAKSLLEQMGGIYAYTESDEISLLLPPNWDLFDRDHEKVVSLSAGIASSAFSLACGASAHFDSRVWLGTSEEQVVDYFRWRHADAARCALNGWCYWTLRKDGQSVGEATRALIGKSTAFKNELLFQHGINFNDLPAWQRRGTGLFWEVYTKEGYNPKTRETAMARRRRIKVDRDLPLGDAYGAYVRTLLPTVQNSVADNGKQGHGKNNEKPRNDTDEVKGAGESLQDPSSAILELRENPSPDDRRS
jgi:tRNA(His) guanylyltransferase